MSRPPRAWLGLDLGASKLLGVLVDQELRVEQRCKTETRREDGPEAVLERCVRLLRELRGRGRAVGGVGVGFAGLVDPARGSVSSSIMLPGWEGFPLARRLSAALDVPARLDNDATAAGYGELAALGFPAGLNMVVLTVGTGIGGAIVVNGELYRGATGVAGELGNTTIDWRGDRSWCRNAGALNLLASGSAIAARAAVLAQADRGSLLHGTPPPWSLETVAQAAARGDAAAQSAIELGARALGAGIANFINAFNPHRVALTGGVLELGDGYLETVRAEARERAFAEAFAACTISRSVAGYDAGALGAAGLARDSELAS